MSSKKQLLPIFIPSMDRAGAIFEGTSATLNHIKRVDNPLMLVVPPDQQARYNAACFNRSRQDVEVVACPEKGISKTRQWIGKLAAKKGWPKFAMFDDDLNFAVRENQYANKLRKQEHKDIVEMLAWIDTALNTYAHASVSPRDAAKTDSVASGGAPLTLLNKRLLRVLCYQTAEFLAAKHGRVEVMEDFDVTLQLIRKGKWNIQTYWWTNDQRQTGSPGGCASYRSHEVQAASAKKLAELHAPFVELRTKKNKASVVASAAAFRERTEVTIQWEKAAFSAGWKKGEAA